MARMQPVAYIRKSTKGGADSKADQIANVRDLARPEDRDRLVILAGDWGISAAREKQAKRLDFRRLMEMVEAGEVLHLYAYSADRLARNVGWSARLLDACKDAGVRITTGERTYDPADSMDRQQWHFLAMQNEGEIEKYQRKAIDREKRKRERGVKLGPPFYGALRGESLEAVLAAFDESGSAYRAARLLNERGLPSRRGKIWTGSVVRNILVREGRMPKLGTRGAKPRAPFYLYRLLRCHCGRILTANKQPTRNLPRRVVYRCIMGEADPAHGLKSVTEARLLPWVMAEADSGYQAPTFVAADVTAERAALEAERAQATKLALVPGADLDVVRTKLEDIERRLGMLADAVTAEDVGAIDWTWPPAQINTVLRAYWHHVELDEAMRPVRAAWRF